MTSKIEPLGDRVLLQREESQQQTPGGIYIPHNAQEKQARGVVVNVGPGRLNDTGEREPMNVTCGDRVLFGKFSGTEIEVDGEKYVLVREDDILAVLRD